MLRHLLTIGQLLSLLLLSLSPFFFKLNLAEILQGFANHISEIGQPVV